jgi:D-alanine-D-alanine ligase
MVAGGRKLRVAVLMGGLSSERNVSFSSGKQILDNLDPNVYDVSGVDAATIPGSTLRSQETAGQEIEDLARARDELLSSVELRSFSSIMTDDPAVRPDLAFLALHGSYGEDGTVQGILELLGIPYTGSGVLASSLAMDKSMAKKVMASSDIDVPRSVDIVCRNGQWDEASVCDAVEAMGYPVVVKPSRQGSTFGCTKVDCADGLSDAVEEAAKYDCRVLIEQFVSGTELTVSVLGNSEPFALPVIEIVPTGGFYDYERKYKQGATLEIVPARISPEETRWAQRLAVRAHEALGCRGVSRVDIISGPQGMRVLEVNTIPGMTPTSLLPRAAAAAGIEFGKLLDMIVGYALEEGSDR